MMELNLRLNHKMDLELIGACIFKSGIGIRIESAWFGLELNQNRLLPKLHIIDNCSPALRQET